MPAGFYGLVKLINGEELISKVISTEGETIVLEDPVILYRSIAPNGMTWIQCSHWLLFNKANVVEVNKSMLITLVGDLHDNVINNYENFLKEGGTEMDERHREAEAKMQSKASEMVRGGEANTTIH